MRSEAMVDTTEYKQVQNVLERQIVCRSARRNVVWVWIATGLMSAAADAVFSALPTRIGQRLGGAKC